MQQYTLQILASQQPTVLERLLQVTRYRGFEVTEINMLPDVESQLFEIEMTVESLQPIERLRLQLNKLFDVNQISIQQAIEQQCRA
ncbi:acetolactate synthase 2 small subunit [Parashewanella spongiae]|uniref:Acetolactate synthase 2 small subunit n=1 Tax=Parashewanella spongiae TaxID=342950 RepID=A0A3A6THG9_9GAMM|nr:acetolactate synthase 2 small subunit [Parashewanella spongiae]MCL1079612.1 acetolactate synthase 2 small subunit [Parashewanella spongiae]RJY07188.1 acetolactate synthase 2 small subunit [Parashewanella spongiae]